MEWLQHLFHNDHGEWTAILALGGAGAWRAWLRGLLVRLRGPLRYRVVHQKVKPPFFNPEVETIVHGPFRSKLYCVVLAHLVCGPWDKVTVQEWAGAGEPS